MIAVSAIVQARMNSTRFPGKALYPLVDIPLTEHIINRIKAATNFDHIVLAVPNIPSETPLVEMAQRLNITIVRGPEDNVLERFLIAAEKVEAQHIVRICGDNPLIDRQLMRLLIKTHIKENADYTITLDAIPLGTGTEVVNVQALKNIASMTTDPKYKEHVTTWFHDNPTNFVQSHAPAPAYLKNKSHRLTVDTKNDLALMEKVFEEFYTPTSPLPNLEEVIDFLDARPDIAQINSNTRQKNWRF